jgi:FHS family Na+ dependent glucose MFS transporter 1
MDDSGGARERKGLFSAGREALAGTAAYYGSFIVLGLATAVIGPTLPALAEQTGSSLSSISYLFTASSFGYLLGSLFGGRIFDRIRGHPILTAAMFAMMAVVALVPLMSVLWSLLLVILVLGFTTAIVDVGGNTLILWVHGKGVGPFMSGLHFSFGVGALLAPLIVAQVLRIWGRAQLTYWVLPLLILPAALLVLRLPSPGIHASPPGRRGIDDFLFVLLMSLFFFLHVGAEFSFGGWIYTYAVKSGLAGKESSAYLTSLFWGSLTAGRLLGVPLATVLKPRAILLMDLAGCAAGVGALLLWTGTPAVLWIGTVLAGVSIASIFPTSFTFAGHHLHMNGKITAWFLIGASCGAMFLPWLIGQLFEPVGYRVTMGVILVDLLVAVSVILLLLNHSAGRRQRAEAD